MCAVYTISYDLTIYSQDARERVVDKFNAMGATQCLASGWLIRSNLSALDIANAVLPVLGDLDRLLVVAVADAGHMNLMNERRCISLLRS